MVVVAAVAVMVGAPVEVVITRAVVLTGGSVEHVLHRTGHRFCHTTEPHTRSARLPAHVFWSRHPA